MLVEMAEKDKQVMTKEDTKKFTWRIEGFSKLKESELYSDAFLAGGHNWKISVSPNDDDDDDCLSVYLNFSDEQMMPCGWSVEADFRLTLVGQITGSSSVQESFTQKFDQDTTDWGCPSFVPIGDLSQKGYLVNDTLIFEAEVSIVKSLNEVGATDEPKVIEADQASEAIKQVDSLAKLTSSSLSSVLLTSRNLIAQLSTMSAIFNSASSNGISCSNPGHGSVVLQQQREKLFGFLDTSLEALSQSKSLDEAESTALEILKQATDPLEETVLKDLVSRLAEFKETVPSSLSAIETSHDEESSVAQMIKELETRLVHRNGQLTCLEAEVSRLEEEDMKLEVEFQELTARKAKILEHKSSTAVELDKANEEASKELEELKKQHARRKLAGEKRMGAKDKLAQANASWKLFKENLGSCVGEMLSKYRAHVCMVLVQISYTLLYFITEASFKRGFSPYVYVIYRHVVGTLVVFPFAFFLERTQRPKLTVSLFLEIFLLSLLGLESFDLRHPRGVAKVLGTLISLSGVMTMTMYKGPTVRQFWHPLIHEAQPGLVTGYHENWLMGSVLMGVVISGFVIFIQLWCTDEKGPVFVTVFGPLTTILVAILAYFIVGENLYLGSIVGAAIVIVGLYLLLWGKEDDEKAEKMIKLDEETLPSNVDLTLKTPKATTENS
ncbi:Ubiquitin C-terminal hydrolase 12 [Linum perenne]